MKKNKQQDTYDTITENDEVLTNPDQAKEYIAEYFEKLYQARPAKPNYIGNTLKIEKEINNIEMEMEHLPNIQDFSMEEFTKCIKKLKRKKAAGPDMIPNEAFIEADDENKAVFLEAMNNINMNKTIPDIWQEGEICRLYKSKGTKGKCSNERGITLSSNYGKLYERMINERILPIINMTEAQAGGKKGSATVDHILILKELIATAKRQKKNVHIAYLDVTKAYDKAWLTGIMQVLYKQGIKDNHWTLIKRLNENISAKIQTKHGLTRNIQIKDSIRQGGVLSTTLYGLLMDEINKEISKENIGIQIEGTKKKTGSLLWVDDVLIITTEPQELQKGLNITNEVSNQYHIEYGSSKSNTQTIKHSRKKSADETAFTIGEMEIKPTETYKYLGLTQNFKNNHEDHLKLIKGKLEAAYQKMITLTGNSNFTGIEMETIWTVVQACLIPIITYGGETMETKETNYKTVNMLLDNILKRILKTPKSTPRQALYIETGLLDPETIIKKNRISMEIRIKKGDNQMMKEIINLKHEGCWATQNGKIKNEMKVLNSIMRENSRYKVKKELQEKSKLMLKQKLEETAKDKSKMKYYYEGKHDWATGKRARYLNKLTRNQASLIFKTRTRMLKVKGNYKNGHTKLECRLCKNQEETQKHVLEECKKINDMAPKVTKEMIFDEEPEILKGAAKTIELRMEILENETST